MLVGSEEYCPSPMGGLIVMMPRSQWWCHDLNYFLKVNFQYLFYLTLILFCVSMFWFVLYLDVLISVTLQLMSDYVEDKPTTERGERTINYLFFGFVLWWMWKTRAIPLILGQGSLLNQHHYWEVGLMLCDCNGYSLWRFNSQWWFVII